MSQNIIPQTELLKTALEATDAYLGIEKQAIAISNATPAMIQEFNYHMLRAQEALKILNVINNHQAYMDSHIATMAKIYNNSAINVNQPYASMPIPEYGEVEESKETYASAKKQESKLISFANYIREESEDNINEDDINQMVDSLTWEDIIDFYPEEDLIEEETEVLDEKISAQSRLKRRQSFARGRSKRSTAKSIKLRRASTPAILQKRAQLAARRAIYQRFLRGRDKSGLSASEKDRIEQQVRGMKSIQSSIATRMVPKMRSIEQKRLANYRGNK